MKKLLILVCILCLIPITVFADTDSTMNLAKKYEGNFYQFHCDGGWSPISEAGMILGEPQDLKAFVNISYYVNPDENYIIQFYNDDSNMSYAVWQDCDLSTMYSSKY